MGVEDDDISLNGDEEEDIAARRKEMTKVLINKLKKPEIELKVEKPVLGKSEARENIKKRAEGLEKIMKHTKEELNKEVNNDWDQESIVSEELSNSDIDGRTDVISDIESAEETDDEDDFLKKIQEVNNKEILAIINELIAYPSVFGFQNVSDEKRKLVNNKIKEASEKLESATEEYRDILISTIDDAKNYIKDIENIDQDKNNAELKAKKLPPPPVAKKDKYKKIKEKERKQEATALEEKSVAAIMAKRSGVRGDKERDLENGPPPEIAPKPIKTAKTVVESPKQEQPEEEDTIEKRAERQGVKLFKLNTSTEEIKPYESVYDFPEDRVQEVINEDFKNEDHDFVYDKIEAPILELNRHEGATATKESLALLNDPKFLEQYKGLRLMMAAEQGDHNAVKKLLNSDIGFAPQYKAAALLFAINNGYQEVVEVFLNNKFEISPEDKARAFYAAVFRGHLEPVEAFAGAIKDNEIPLIYLNLAWQTAELYKDKKMLNVLTRLYKSVNPILSPISENGIKSFIDHEKISASSKYSLFLISKQDAVSDMMEKIIENPKDFNLEEIDQVMHALKENMKKFKGINNVVNELLSSKDINQDQRVELENIQQYLKNSSNTIKHILYKAAEMGQHEIVQNLLDNHPRILTDIKSNVLTLAVHSGHEKVVAELLKNKKGISDYDLDLVLSAAKRMGNNEIVFLLKQAQNQLGQQEELSEKQVDTFKTYSPLAETTVLRNKDPKEVQPQSDENRPPRLGAN